MLFSTTTCATTGLPPGPSPAPVLRPDRGRPPQRRPLPRPRDEEGKARASCNALKHGLAALHHLVLEDEVPTRWTP